MKWTTIVAAVITIGLNINSVSLVQYLASDDTARANLAQAAYRAANDQNLKNEVNNIQVKDNATEPIHYSHYQYWFGYYDNYQTD